MTCARRQTPRRRSAAPGRPIPRDRESAVRDHTTYHSPTACVGDQGASPDRRENLRLERAMGIEPTTYSLGSSTLNSMINMIAAKLLNFTPNCIKGLQVANKTIP